MTGHSGCWMRKEHQMAGHSARCQSTGCGKRYERREKVEVSVARYLRTPPYGATRKDLVWVSGTAIKQRQRNPERCCHLQLHL